MYKFKTPHHLLRSMILSFLVLFCADLSGQNLPRKVQDHIKAYNLRPLSEVDRVNKDLPMNLVTESGWHVDYYANFTQNDGPVQLNIYEFIYNDSICHTLWSPSKFETVKYDSLFVVNENDKFLYFSNSILKDKLLVVSKTEDEVVFQFSLLLLKDFSNNIFVEYNPSFYCGEVKRPSFVATNIITMSNAEIEFKGQCASAPNDHCIQNVSYTNGKLTIHASVSRWWKRKDMAETKVYDAPYS